MARALQGAAQRRLGGLPQLDPAEELLGPSLERDLDAVEAEGAVDLAGHGDEALELAVELLGRAVDVRVVLRHRAHADQTGERARGLEAVQAAEVRVADGKVAVGMLARREEVAVAGAVHRLDAVFLVLDRHEEHVVAEGVVVAGRLPELRLVDEGRDHLGVAVARVEPADVPDERVVDDRPLGVEEGRARRDRVKREEVEHLAEPPVVALLRLLQALQVRLEVLLAGPRRPVDALELLVARVTPPVRPRDGGQPEGGDAPGRGHVRAAAEVDELALVVQRDGRVGNALDDLDLVVLAHLPEAADRLAARHLFPPHGQVLGDDRAHHLLDAGEILAREPAGPLEVVVEAVLDDRADGDLGLGEEPLHRLRHEVRGRMADDAQALRRLDRDRRQPAVTQERPRQIDDRGPVRLDAGGDRPLEPGAAGAVPLGVPADGLAGRDPRRQALDGSVFERHPDLGHL